MKRLFVGLTLVALIAGSTAAFAQHDQDPEAMMKAYMAAAKPGDQHKMLSSMEGTWDYVMHSYDDPANPMETKGKAVMSMVMGGRYLMQDTEATMMGMPFSGQGITGYNNVTGMYESVWYDNMSTGISKFVGSADGKTITMTGEHHDPLTKTSNPVKTVSTLVSQDKHTFTWYMVMGGQEIKAFEIEYTRSE